MPDEDPKPATHPELEEALAALQMRARILGGFYSSLLCAGFNADQAFALTQDWQEGME